MPRLPLASLPFAVLLGLVAGLLGLSFNYALKHSLALNEKIGRWPPPALPLVACALAGVLGYYLPQVLGGGHLLAEEILAQRVAFGIIPLLFLAKFFLTMVS